MTLIKGLRMLFQLTFLVLLVLKLTSAPQLDWIVVFLPLLIWISMLLLAVVRRE